MPESHYLDAATKGHETYRVIEKWLKGDEQTLPDGMSFFDKGNHERFAARLKWWLADGTDLSELVLLQGEKSDKEKIRNNLIGRFPKQRVLYSDTKPVFVGHYWMTGDPRLQSKYVCCVDYSAGKGDKLCAYQWNGPEDLSLDNFVFEMV